MTKERKKVELTWTPSGPFSLQVFLPLSAFCPLEDSGLILTLWINIFPQWSNQWEFLPILNLFFHLSLFLYRATSQNSCYKCFTVTFRLIQRSRDVLFFFASEVSRVERFLLCLILQGHWRFIPFSQNEHRKFCSIKKKQKSSIAATHSSTNILSIRIVIPLWDAPVSFSLCFSVC